MVSMEMVQEEEEMAEELQLGKFQVKVDLLFYQPA